MNLSQKQQVLEAIHSFEAVDFETAFAQKYKDTATMESVQAGDYSVADLLALGDFKMTIGRYCLLYRI